MNQHDDKIKRQLELENEGIQLGVKRYRDQVMESPLSELPPGIGLMHRAIEPLRKAIEEFLKPSPGGGSLATTRRFLKLIDPYETAYITARRLINAMSSRESLQNVCISLAGMLYDHLEYLRFKEEAPNYVKVLEENLKTQNEDHRRKVILRAKRKAGIEDLPSTTIERLHIGMKLVDLFIESTGLLKKERTPDTKSAYTLRGTDEALEWISNQHARCELLDPVYLPMIVSPVPWTSPYDGGFLTNSTLLRLRLVKTSNREYLERLEDHDMPLVYRTVNALQDTPWRINRKILHVMREVWRLDSGLGGLPRDEKEPLPPAPWTSDEEFERLKQEHPEVVKAWKRRATEVYERRLQTKTKRIQLAQKLWIAERFEHEPEIYFVWTMDWRGRLYPVQPFVNPQADDTGKALLEFAHGKEIGHEGFRWLCIHLANKFGEDKIPFTERVEWVRQKHDDILQVAEDPLTFTWWTEADSPWQFLAACFEYAEVFTSGELYAYESRLPIAMDGTCNGLQNLSAMLLDEVGGEAVNLTPSDKPQDVYQAVADVVSKRIEQEAAEGDELAKAWVGKVDRGIAKRPVMTTPYGATRFGMADQIAAELAKRNSKDGRYLDIEDEYPATIYLAKKLYEGIGEVVIAARQAMDWLQEVAKLLATEGVPVTWTTPAGFLVCQAYMQQQNKMIKTFWGSARVMTRVTLNFNTDKIDSRKQAAGISPNFVHSMDASHLMLTVNKALDEGITSFAMIHDSYGTHAADAERLSEILRETFVQQYTEDVLERFKREVSTQVSVELPPVPPKGTLDLSGVLRSQYFFA